MNILLLSGGSGKRLWPLSNDTQSKQFLRLLKDDNGKKESMVQRVYRQLKKTVPDAVVYAASNVSQVESIANQIGDVECIAEPERRDTFPAIVLSAAYLYFNKECARDDRFVVCPIDPYAELLYFELLSNVEQLLDKYNIGLLGCLPTVPTSKYGYILRSGPEVRGFFEKPSEEEAARLINEGALWNCGVFAVTVGYVLDKAKEFIEFDSYGDVLNNYGRLPKISFDYMVVEKEKSIGVVEYKGVWKDLGTWNTLTEEIDYVIKGSNVLLSEDCTNTHVINMLEIPIIGMDLHDFIVVASHDGILVSSKPGSKFMKPLADSVKLRPMYEQRSWGNYRVLEYKHSEGYASLVKRVMVEAGKLLQYQYHNDREKTWIIISGKGILTVDGADSVASPGGVIHIPECSTHSLLAATDMELIEVQLGKGSLDEDGIIPTGE